MTGIRTVTMMGVLYKTTKMVETTPIHWARKPRLVAGNVLSIVSVSLENLEVKHTIQVFFKRRTINFFKVPLLFSIWEKETYRIVWLYHASKRFTCTEGLARHGSNCFSVTGLSRSFPSCLFFENNGVDALLFTNQTFSLINLIISNRTLDFKPRCYSIELSFTFLTWTVV